MELDSEHLRDDVQIRHESRLENDGDVRSVEQFDRIAAVLTPVASWLDWKVHTESLQELEKLVYMETIAIKR